MTPPNPTPAAPTRSRDEHLAWAKTRALEYLNRGDAAQAFTSMASDLKKHPELNYHETLYELGLLYLMAHNVDMLRRWIEGFR
jgi:Tfp pilus assembly protein PilF